MFSKSDHFGESNKASLQKSFLFSTRNGLESFSSKSASRASEFSGFSLGFTHAKNNEDDYVKKKKIPLPESASSVSTNGLVPSKSPSRVPRPKITITRPQPRPPIHPLCPIGPSAAKVPKFTEVRAGASTSPASFKSRRCDSSTPSAPRLKLSLSERRKSAPTFNQSKPDLNRPALKTAPVRWEEGDGATVIELLSDDGGDDDADKSASRADTASDADSSTLLIFPVSGVNRITVSRQDLLSLDAGKELNDTIIDFYLRYIYETLVPDQLRTKVHIFSTYFYKRLTDKTLAQDEDRTESLDRRRHRRVSKWTKNVDVFDKDFLFVPVNYKGEHWFLIVICYPTISSAQYDSYTPPDSILPATRVTRRPCVLVFDSVSGGSAVAQFTSNVVVGYLQEEFADKKASGLSDAKVPDFRKRLKCLSPVVPLQEGDVDCGLFLLQFAESFFSHPISDFSDDFLRARAGEEGLRNWFPAELINNKRKHVRDLILKLSHEGVR